MIDELTRLPDRAALDTWLRTLDPSGADREIWVCRVGLDRFDAVNEALGVPAGDELLIQAAQRLGELSGQRGHRVARLDGDEFCLLMSSDHADDLMAAADEALAVLREPYRIGAQQVAITASAGLVDHRAAQDNPAGLLSLAGIALHWAKSDGKGRCRKYEPERKARDIKRTQLWLALPSAMACDQILLHYQPLVNLRDGNVVGAEALARWSHPTHGRIPPETFVGIAEETGLISTLGAMLLRNACAAAMTWSPGPDGPYVSVNVSAAQLQDPSLETTVTTTLEHTGLAPHRLQLEITEHSMIDTSRRTQDTLRRLAQLGIRIAIDDFGTGYSNLATLPALPLHELKLALPLTQAGTRDFLTTIVKLGLSLNLTMTAEGIETDEQAKLMRELGCHTGQGWHFSHPMTTERTREYMRGHR